jgi:hypothetical protein
MELEEQVLWWAQLTCFLDLFVFNPIYDATENEISKFYSYSYIEIGIGLLSVFLGFIIMEYLNMKSQKKCI